MQNDRINVQGRFLALIGTLQNTAVDPLVLARWSGSRNLKNTDDANRQVCPGPGGTTDPMNDGPSCCYVTQ